ncbi:elongator complex protein 4 isoform 2-T2 [Anomaloglossus baeobatrachus]|uniref:elongator complex protein 4 isoform X2 n=1 Tax=Anomaloglossus baeobatrachus TaxID=238106 RepID=UPI003F4F75F2
MAAPSVRGVSAGAGAATGETSFRRKVRGKLPAIRGTRPSVHNGQLLVSTGVPSLDHILGGGLAVGTLLLIEEDTYSTYSNLLLKYFLAEGVISGHEVFIASASDIPCKIIQDLPEPLTDEIPTQGDTKYVLEGPGSEDTMKIAWRYQNLPKFESASSSSARFGHYYDMSKTMSPDMLQSAKTHSFYLPSIIPLDGTSGFSSEMSCDYLQLLQSIQSAIHQGSFDGSNPQKGQKKILRIGIQSLASVLWGDDLCSQERPHNPHSLTRFLYALRGLLRSSLSVGVITVPTHLLQNKAIIARVRNLSDTVVSLESFISSERESNPLYKDYHGLFLVHKIPRLNSLISDVSDTKDLAFKLKRKMFSIEMGQNREAPYPTSCLMATHRTLTRVRLMTLLDTLRKLSYTLTSIRRLHLPPDLSDTVSRSSKQDLAGSTKLLSSGCGSAAAGKKHLDF